MMISQVWSGSLSAWLTPHEKMLDRVRVSLMLWMVDGCEDCRDRAEENDAEGVDEWQAEEEVCTESMLGEWRVKSSKDKTTGLTSP